MPPTFEIRRVKCDDDNPNIHLSITTSDNEMHYAFNKREGRPAMRFARVGIGAFVVKQALPIVIPPPADDDGIRTHNHFFAHSENVFYRGYVAILSGQHIFTSPALLLADSDATTVPDFFIQLGDFFGKSLRIVSPNAIQKHWRGRLDEFDNIVHHDGQRYHRRFITWSNHNDKIYASGIPISRYLDLLQTHPPQPNMSYEAYFEYLRKETKRGGINPSPWSIEEVYPNHPRLF